MDVFVCLLLVWIVGLEDFYDGEEILLIFLDFMYYVGKFVVWGDFWDDVCVGVMLMMMIEEVVVL